MRNPHSEPNGNMHSDRPERSGRNQRGDESGSIRYPGTCTAVIGSMTQTIRAQEALAAASVRSSLTKIGSAQTRSGCAYGLYYPCVQTPNVRAILNQAGVPVRRYLGEDGE